MSAEKLLSAPAVQYGRRLIPQLISERAEQEPTKIFASIPISNKPESGFTDVSYSTLAKAVDRASWWLYEIMAHSRSQEVLAYMGPNDLRYPIFVVAAMKCGYTMLLPSPRNPDHYQHTIVSKTGCQTLLCTRNLVNKVQGLAGDGMCLHVVPELAEMLDSVCVESFPYSYNFDEVKDRVFLVLHTSGSTGPPKPISFTVECTTTEDTHRLLDDPSNRLWWRLFADSRYFLGMPCYHSAGIWFALFLPIYLNSTVVYGPSDRPLTATIADAVHKHGHVNGGFYPPSVLEEIVSTQALNAVNQLDFMAFGGGPISQSAGDELSRRTTLHNFIGFTEASAPPRYVMEPNDWNYFEFHPAAGHVPEHLHDDLYRMVFRRQPEYEFSQTVFRLYPRLQQYAPGDILSPHPTKPNLWSHRGREDDLIVLSTGEKFNPLPVEQIIKTCKVVNDAVVIGNGRKYAALLVEREQETTAGMKADEIAKALWPYVVKSNSILSTQARLVRDHILIVPADKEFSRSAKGTIQRKATEDRFSEEIYLLYYGLSVSSMVSSITEASCEPQDASDLTASTPADGRESEPFTPSDDELLFKDSQVPVKDLALGGFDSGAHSSRDDMQPSKYGHDAFQTVVTILKETCGLSSIKKDDNLFDLGVDSIQVMQISSELAHIYENWPRDQEAAIRRIYDSATIGDLVDALNGPSLTIKNSTPMTTPITASKPTAGENIVPANLEPDPELSVMRTDDILTSLIDKYTTDLHRTITVALIGSTGAIGSHMYNHLLQDSRVSRVINLNRSENGTQAQHAAFTKHCLPSVLTSTATTDFYRIDLSRPDLGLEIDQYADLMSGVDVIIHGAWKLDFLQNVQSFEKVHIAGVRHIVDLAAKCHRRPRIIFLDSIASVLGWAEERNVPEEPMRSSDAVGSNGYAQSKYVAQRILLKAAESAGVRASIVRLGQIAGPTEDVHGVWKRSEWLPQVLRTSVSLGAVPSSLGAASEIDWVPVDLVPQVLMELIYHDIRDDFVASEPFRVYHLRNPQRTSWASLLPAICSKLGPETKVVSYSKWLSMLRSCMEAGFDVTQYPAAKLLTWLVSLDMPPSVRLPVLDIRKAATVSSTLASMEAVSGIMMEKWMKSWELEPMNG
ncbi:acetyl- synthetase [Fusarium sporotrichioides]|uniref:Acetyl-synthetase n=1 Tax=Fusarium sporotrichioides TaxID=5514 RepID=A0A395RS47_FUSSP|nr:acetyl- synthetase [Fusarium sporotrichioides]